MNQGREPGHDDYGLPRVDVQIPDDARELYRDVQAYHRELRAMRRQQRSRRWRAPLRKSGMIVPVIAGCLVLAMIAGMVLTMFSANPYFAGISDPGQPHAGATQPTGPAGLAPNSAPASAGPTSTGSASTGPASTGRSSPPAGHGSSAVPGVSAAPRLPGATITVAGLPVMLRRLSRTVLAIVPAGCACAMLIRQLLSQASKAGVTVYLVGRAGSMTELKHLAPSSARGTALLAIDSQNALGTTYKPAGLTLLLVDARGGVTVKQALRPGFQIEPQLRKLRQAS